MGFFDYTKEYDVLVCIDSDGCAMDTMDVMCQKADLTAVSSANGEAVEAEWSKHGLKEDTKALLSQEVFPKLIEGSFEEAYQKQLIEEFEANLSGI